MGAYLNVSLGVHMILDNVKNTIVEERSVCPNDDCSVTEIHTRFCPHCGTEAADKDHTYTEDYDMSDLSEEVNIDFYDNFYEVDYNHKDHRLIISNDEYSKDLSESGSVIVVGTDELNETVKETAINKFKLKHKKIIDLLIKKGFNPVIDYGVVVYYS